MEADIVYAERPGYGGLEPFDRNECMAFITHDPLPPPLRGRSQLAFWSCHNFRIFYLTPDGARAYVSAVDHETFGKHRDIGPWMATHPVAVALAVHQMEKELHPLLEKWRPYLGMTIKEAVAAATSHSAAGTTDPPALEAGATASVLPQAAPIKVKRGSLDERAAIELSKSPGLTNNQLAELLKCSPKTLRNTRKYPKLAAIRRRLRAQRRTFRDGNVWVDRDRDD